MTTGIPLPQYESLIEGLGYFTTQADTGFIRGETLRQSGVGDGLDDRRFRYASVLDPQKLGVTDIFELNGAPCIYMKSLAAEPSAEDVRNWHRTAWNHGLGRMLWVVTPQQVRVLNAFEPPPKSHEGHKHPAEILRCALGDLEQLRKYELDRISLETGQFWSTTAGKRISKETRIDATLADDLLVAAEILTERGCKPLQAHRLMLRTLFTAYLEARKVLPNELFEGLNAKTFGDVLKSVVATRQFFERMREAFNGDLGAIAKRYSGDTDILSNEDLRIRITRNKMDFQALRQTIARTAAESRAGNGPSAATSIIKYAAAESAKARSELMVEAMGHQALGWDGAGYEPSEVLAVRGWLRTKANSIEGGTSEVNLNVIAKRVLGLPDMK